MAVVPKCLFYGKLTFLDAYFIGNSLKITLGEYWGRWRFCFFEFLGRWHFCFFEFLGRWRFCFLNFWLDGVFAFFVQFQ